MQPQIRFGNDKGERCVESTAARTCQGRVRRVVLG